MPDQRVPQPIKRVINRWQLECAQAGAILYSVGLGRPSAAERKVGTKVKFAASLHWPVRQPDGMLSENTARGGTKAKPSGVSASADGFAVCVRVLTWINAPICKVRCCEFGRGSSVVLYPRGIAAKGCRAWRSL